MSTYLAVDIGASSGRHIVGRLEKGRLVTEEVYRFQNGATERDGRLVWDTRLLFDEIVSGLKVAGEKGLKPDFVGIDTWAVDYVLLDNKDDPIFPVYAYRDRRGGEAAARLHEILSFEDIYSRTGIQFQPFNTVYQLYDDLLSGRLDRAQSMLMLPDYFDYLLTGVKKQEYTNATSTALVNARTHAWDEELIARAGLKKSLFGKLSQPGTVVGKFLPEIAEKVGYDATVILPATHDTASAVLAAPLSGKNCCYISSGTWSLLGCEQDAAHTDENSRACNYSNEGSIDYKFRFQKNIMGLWMIQQVRLELGRKYSFAELADMAEKDPTDILVDVNDARFLAPKNMIAEIEAAAGGKFDSVGKLAYCVFDSLAECYRESIRQLEGLTNTKYETINIIGGGCNNTLLNRLTAKKCGKRVVAGPAESTAIGNIAVQMIANREITSLKEAREIIKRSFDIKEVSV